ncbi:MAG: glycosyltransferase family 39 protein, partial [bacterium]|nr:glycosyltransferase family 39 protein [bacterium]
MKYLLSSKTLLILILLLGLFFRIYKLEIFYPWGHDQDLFAWIAKDILIDGHFRLIGQETSIIGVFIGPLFYYLIAVSFAFFNMNPLSAALVTTIVSLATIVSIYWVFNKFFGRSVGLIGTFLYAISPGTVFLDRWVVPTQPTILWSVWFVYVLLSILKGNFQILIPLSILVGLIWHVHIAFIPLLILLPVAFWLSDKKNRKKNINLRSLIISLAILFSFVSAFFVFEIRHGFQQTKSVINATYQDKGDLTGGDRLIKVITSGGSSLAGAFTLSDTATNLNPLLIRSLPFLLLIGIFYLWYKRILSKSQTILFVSWYATTFLGQFFSKRIITEYYFNNLFVILFLTLALILTQFKTVLRKFPVIEILLVGYLVVNFAWLINRQDDLGGFLYKRQAIEFIKADASAKGYNCIAVN